MVELRTIRVIRHLPDAGKIRRRLGGRAVLHRIGQGEAIDVFGQDAAVAADGFIVAIKGIGDVLVASGNASVLVEVRQDADGAGRGLRDARECRPGAPIARHPDLLRHRGKRRPGPVNGVDRQHLHGRGFGLGGKKARHARQKKRRYGHYDQKLRKRKPRLLFHDAPHCVPC